MRGEAKGAALPAKLTFPNDLKTLFFNALDASEREKIKINYFINENYISILFRIIQCGFARLCGDRIKCGAEAMSSYHEILLNYLDEEGQIIKFLMDGPQKAGDIYKNVRASQPSISQRLARMVDENMLVSKRDRNDRRVVWYALSDAFHQRIQIERDARALSRGIVL
jgi:DNA-binding MarR family transcriptional regulator